MANPTKYTPSFSFAGYQTTNPTRPLPGVRVDVENNNIANSLNGTIDALADIRRDDGKLQNGIVTPESLDPGMALGVLPPTPWVSGIQYKPPQSVWYGNKLYQCILQHVSTVFATDLANQCWNLVVDFDPPIQEATDAAAAAKISETNAKASETSAAADAASATTSKNAAAASATAADSSKVAAAGSASSASASAATATTEANRAQSEADRAQGIANAMTPDAPSNGTSYGRLNGAWQPVVAASAYTAADVLTKIKTVDGVGSGLDADLLDGLNSSFFAPVNNPALTGVPTAPTPALGDNSIQIATTAFVKANDALLAPKDSPAFSGTPTAPVAPPGTNTAQIATTSFVAASFVTTGQATATFAPLASPALTGNPTAPTLAAGNNGTAIATTAFVQTAINLLKGTASPGFDTLGEIETVLNSFTPALALKADLASPVFTGNPQAPTPAGGDNDTSVATTAFVTAALAAAGAVPTAQARNRIVNPAMQVSQEWGDTLGGPVASLSYYAADQWLTATISGGTQSAQRVQLRTPNKSADRIRLTVGTADAALAANEYQQWLQAIEGKQIADFGWGAAGARQVILRFGFKGPAGTYAASLRNGPANRCYVVPFTISAGQANTDTEQVFVVPGDTTGVWDTTEVRGMYVTISVGSGANFQAASGNTWLATNSFSLAGLTNGLAAAGAVYELFDVGLYLDPLNTGLPPRFEIPEYSTELAKCQRYWQQTWGAFYGFVQASTAYLYAAYLPVAPRPNPILSGANYFAANAFSATVGTLSLGSDGCYVSEVRTSLTTPATTNFARFGSTVTVNGRM